MVQRWIAVASALVFVGVVGVLIWKSGPPAARLAPGRPASSTGAVSGPTDPAGMRAAQPTTADRQAPASPLETHPFDGGTVPPLPASAPSSVTFGVVLVAYRGAEFAPSDSPEKSKALDRAKALSALAMENFDEAVKKGDQGSVSDAGRIPRNILEPALEYLLFTLSPNTVHPHPIDTPRGYWIVRRIR